MTETSYQPDTIIAYLLGTLSASEAEQFDELSITDPSFSEALQTVELDLVDAYVLNELDEKRRHQFESYYLNSSRSRYNTAFALALQTFGERQAKLSASGHREQAAVTKGGWLSRVRSYLAPRQTWQWGFAVAALLLLLVGVWLFVQNRRLQNQLEVTRKQTHELAQREEQLRQALEDARAANVKLQPSPSPGETVTPQNERLDSPSAIFSLMLLPPVRSNQSATTIQLKQETTGIAVTLVLEPNPYSTFRVALLDSGGRQLWRSSPVMARIARDNKVINIRFPANLLTTSSYTLRVFTTAEGGVEVVGDYPIRVEK